MRFINVLLTYLLTYLTTAIIIIKPTRECKPPYRGLSGPEQDHFQHLITLHYIRKLFIVA